MQHLQPFALPIACVLAGCSIGLIALILGRIVNANRKPRDTFEETRRSEVRKASGTYRLLEPLVDEVAGLFSVNYQTDQLAHHLQLLDSSVPWKPNEFMATKTLEGTVVGVAIFALVAPFGFPVFAVALAAGTGWMFPMLAKKSVISEAKNKLHTLKLRLPFAIDQISLMMEAGAGFEDSLRTVVADNTDHPLSREFSEVIRQMSLGRPRSQALRGFRDRLADDDVSEIVFAIIKGEELGTPLSSILREQATQMRLKRSQWGEKAASEAEVQMVFPGMITMVACLLVIVAPILLPVVVQFLES